jgi:hypothetical protein
MNLVRLSCLLGLPVLVSSCDAPGGNASDAEASLAARRDDGVGLTGVPRAVARSAGVTVPNALSPELMAVVAAQGRGCGGEPDGAAGG